MKSATPLRTPIRQVMGLVICLGLSMTLSGCKKSAPQTEAVAASSSSVAVTSPLEAFNKPATTSNGATPAPVLPANMPVPPAPTIEARGFVLMDFASGQILAEQNSHDRMEPASLTKLMTAYITFDALRIGKIKLTDLAHVSEYAWRTGGAGTDGSTSFIPLNSDVPIETLLLGMIVQSGNDASIALAEHIAGNEQTFAELMRQYAAHLGMKDTSFGNATGLPSPLDYTTPHDMALLAQALVRDFPQYYHYFSVKEYTFNNTTQHNRNGLLSTDPSVDGLKTGHTAAAGYCLVSSAKRDGMRLIGVVMNTPSIKAREAGIAALFNYGFSFYETRTLFAANQPLQTMPVLKGKADSVSVTSHDNISATIQRGRADTVQTRVEMPKALVAPLQPDQTVGTLVLLSQDKELGRYALYPTQAVEQAGVFGRMIDSVKLWFK